tara:strand:+ start:48 stop:911 length:864 start_codon:yes stop_codon:yes gene_type:complete
MDNRLKNNKICVVGCSHIFGTDLLDCDDYNSSKSVWPSLMFPDAIDNIAKPGASCKTVQRRLMIYLTQYIPDAIIIQWPNLLRWEILDDDFVFCGKDFPYQTNKEFEVISYNKTADSKYKNLLVTLSNEEIAKTNLEAIVSINEYLKNVNISCVNLFADAIPKFKWPEYYYVENVTEPINFWSSVYKRVLESFGLEYAQLPQKDIVVHQSDRQHGDPYIRLMHKMIYSYPILDFDGESWLTWCKQQQFPRLRHGVIKQGDGHYSELAHQEAAILLKTKISDLLNINK